MPATPTVVLVHGAFADASGLAGMIRVLQSRGIQARAPMNPLRGLASDADAIARYTSAIDGPILLAGHSYGGAVISQAVPLILLRRSGRQLPRPPGGQRHPNESAMTVRALRRARATG